MTDSREIVAARAEVERSRARVMSTAQELQERLSPKTLAKGAWQGAKEKGHTIVIGGKLYSDAMGDEGTEEGTYIGMVRHNVDTIVNALK